MIPQIKDIILMLHKKKFLIISKFLLFILKYENYSTKLTNYISKLNTIQNMLNNYDHKSDSLIKNGYSQLIYIVETKFMPLVSSFHDRKFIGCALSTIHGNNQGIPKILIKKEILNRLIQFINIFGYEFCKKICVDIVQFKNFENLTDIEQLNFFIITVRKLQLFLNKLKADHISINNIKKDIDNILHKLKNIEIDSDSSYLFDTESDDEESDIDIKSIKKTKESNLITIENIDQELNDDFDNESVDDILSDFMDDEPNDDDDENQIIDSLDLIDK